MGNNKAKQNNTNSSNATTSVLEKDEIKNIQSDKSNNEDKSTKEETTEEVLDIESIEEIKDTETEKDIKIEEHSASEDLEYKLAEQTLTKKSHTYVIIIAILSILCVIAIIVFCTIFALLNMNNSTIIQGVSIKGINVSGLTKEEALSKVQSETDNILNTNLVLNHNEFETTLLPSQFDAHFDVESAVNTAYDLGRNGNILENNFSILFSKLHGNNIDINLSYNHDTLLNYSNDLSNKLPDCVVQPAHCVEGNELIITNGKTGVMIDSIKLINTIISKLNSFSNIDEPIDIPVYSVDPEDIDIEAIYNEIHSEPSDAYYTTDPLMVYPHKDGLDFAISLDEAKALLQEPKDEYIIQLEVIPANVHTSDIGLEAFPDSLADFSTTFSSSNYNRSTNIRLASEKIDGVVLMPGETFSYNSTVGKRTAEAGFKEAGVYVNGEVSTDYGGGICQVSSTLYNAVLLANLEIVERHNHYFQTGYVKPGTDATVSWGTLDFQFKNNRTYPIKLVCSGTGGKVYCEIRGLRQDPEYEVEITSSIIQTINYPTVYQKSSSPAGTVLQKGSNGCKSVAYRILKLNGEIISKTLLSTDTYNPHKKVVASN